MEKEQSISDFVKMELLKHLEGRMAYNPVKGVLSKVTFRKAGIRPYNLPYSFYEVFYHIVYAQKDILNFIVSEKYDLPKWPKDYWPKHPSPVDEAEWEKLKQTYFQDLKQIEALLENPIPALDKPVKHATDKEQSLLREVLLILEHAAYHTGQLLILLRLLGLYP